MDAFLLYAKKFGKFLLIVILAWILIVLGGMFLALIGMVAFLFLGKWAWITLAVAILVAGGAVALRYLNTGELL